MYQVCIVNFFSEMEQHQKKTCYLVIQANMLAKCDYKIISGAT